MENCYAVVSANNVSTLNLSEFRNLTDDTVVYFNDNTEAYCMWIGEELPSSLSLVEFQQFNYTELQSYIS
tara:strand:- start:488 stop:697 length:210 start_codon:yes stop_codon:yes gene_type:complete